MTGAGGMNTYGNDVETSLGQSSVTMLGTTTDAALLLGAGSQAEEQATVRVNWDNLQIEETQDMEGRVQIMSDERLYDLVGLRAEDERAKKSKQAENERAKKAKHDAAKKSAGPPSDMRGDTDGASIPVQDVVPEGLQISYDKDHPTMDLGTMYPCMNEFRMAVRQFAINEEFELGTEKSDKDRFRAYCKGEGCNWSIVGRLQSDNRTVKVTTLFDQHDCTSSSRIKTITPSRAWVADKAVGILRSTPNMGPKELQKKLQDDYSVTIAYDTVWKGREIALQEIYGSWEESFHMLYSWKEEVMKRSPGSVVEIDAEEIDGQVYFRRFFCALSPCIEGFKDGCRPYLSVDSTALNGRWNGHLAAASAVDGHNWMYPVAFGFIDSETEDNWTWFMSQLKKAIGDPPVLAISADACKGLDNAVKKVFPGAEQRECFWHLMQNFIKRWHGDSFGVMWPAAWAYRREVFEKHMTKVLTAAPDVADWMRDYHSLKWMRCAFNQDIKCDYVTNNLAEVFNKWVKDIKDLPVCELADKLTEMIMTLWHKRRRIGERLHGRILPAVMLQLKAGTRGLGHLKVVPSTNWSALVSENSTNHGKHIVKLRSKECTCLEWQHTGKPCQHALAFLTTQKNVNLQEFVHEYYSVDKFKAAYGREIEPLTDKSQWPKVDLPFYLRAPLGKRSVGRQRKQRIKSCLEVGGKSGGKDAGKDDGKKKKMIRGPITCKRCGEKGHRQASYKCKLNGTRKRTRKPRKNTTRACTTEVSTPQRATREAIMQDSPGMVTRRRLAMLLGEGTSSQPTMTTSSPKNKSAPKKLTPRKRRTAEM